MSTRNGIKINPADARGFLFFLLLTTIVATLIKLSKDYEVNRTLKVEVVELPLNKTVSTIEPEYVEIRAKTTGFSLLRNTFNGKTLTVPYDKLDPQELGAFSFEPADHPSTIQKSLAMKSSIITMRPKVLTVTVDSLASKRVAVVPRTNITYATGFNAASSITAEPDSITVVGPSVALDKISLVQTETLIIEEANDDIETMVSIQTDSIYSSLKFSQNEIKIKQPVTQFTEGTVTVPITILNDRKNKLKILPKNVQIVYKVSLDDFEKVGASDFVVICDYNKTLELSEYVPLKLEKIPSSVREARLTTKQVKYIIVN